MKMGLAQRGFVLASGCRDTASSTQSGLFADRPAASWLTSRACPNNPHKKGAGRPAKARAHPALELRTSCKRQVLHTTLQISPFASALPLPLAHAGPSLSCALAAAQPAGARAARPGAVAGCRSTHRAAGDIHSGVQKHRDRIVARKSNGGPPTGPQLRPMGTVGDLERVGDHNTGKGGLTRSRAPAAGRAEPDRHPLAGAERQGRGGTPDAMAMTLTADDMGKLLLTAASSGDVAEIERLLSAGALVDWTSPMKVRRGMVVSPRRATTTSSCYMASPATSTPARTPSSS